MEWSWNDSGWPLPSGPWRLRGEPVPLASLDRDLAHRFNDLFRRLDALLAASFSNIGSSPRNPDSGNPAESRDAATADVCLRGGQQPAPRIRSAGFERR